MAHYTVTIEETGESYRCSDQETLLVGMEKLGRRGIPVGCRGGGCGVCKIEVVSGSFSKRRMSREYVSEADEAAGRVLACRVRPSSDVVLRVLGLMKKNVCGDAALKSRENELTSRT
jgi:ferredoxin